MGTPRILSYGAGLDSFAMLVKSVQLGDKPDLCVFVDVGAVGVPGEWPGTYKHLREVAIPYARRNGIEFVTIDSTTYPVRDASSLWQWLWDRKQIPVAGPNRICTRIAKVERFEAWAADRFPRQLVEVWVGFEAGEEKRTEKDPNAGGKGNALRRNRFPLQEWGLCRCRCVELVKRAGLPVPRKSACMFCPYGSMTDWQTLKREQPEVFARVVELEARKPPTEAGEKLAIMGHVSRGKRKHLDASVPFVQRTLDQWVTGKAAPRKKPCAVCGAAQKATKATGCGWLEAA